MGSWYKVISLILSVLFSDSFRKLVELALEIVKRLAGEPELMDTEKRRAAVNMLKAQAEVAGLAFGDWLVGYAVETALALDRPSRTRGVESEDTVKEVK